MMLGLKELKESRTCNCTGLWHSRVVVVVAAVENGGGCGCCASCGSCGVCSLSIRPSEGGGGVGEG